MLRNNLIKLIIAGILTAMVTVTALAIGSVPLFNEFQMSGKSPVTGGYGADLYRTTTTIPQGESNHGAQYPELSPDKAKLVFVSDVNGSRDLWISDANGKNAVPLTPWPDTDEKQPSWSPDGNYIVFSSNRNSTKHNIWVIESNGTGAKQLTFDDAVHEQPRYSPQGSSILYLSNSTGKKELWIMNSDGTGQKSIALIGRLVSDPAWSPNGQQIVYVGCRKAGACNLFRINTDGSNGFQITSGDFQDWNPDWGSSGIIFASDRGGSQGLWLIQANGTGLQQVTAPEGTADLDPRWSRDGSFVFSRSGSSPTDAASDIWFATSPGAPPKQLTQLGLDNTPPVITPSVTGPVGTNGWHIGSVNVMWQVTDAESGVATSNGCTPSALTDETNGVTLTCTATNGVGLSTSSSVTIKIDKSPPNISGMPLTSCKIWPPNNKLVQIATISSSDVLSGIAPNTFRVTATSSEPSDPTQPDIIITTNESGGFIVQLRAKRLGTGSGRIYTLTATARDMAGNTRIIETSCTVPHDNR